MCTPACEKRQAEYMKNYKTLVNRANNVNQQLAQKAYNERMAQVQQQRIQVQQQSQKVNPKYR